MKAVHPNRIPCTGIKNALYNYLFIFRFQATKKYSGEKCMKKICYFNYQVFIFIFISVSVVVFLPYPKSADSQTPKRLKTVRMITTSWPPYFGPNLPKNGYFCEIVRQAFLEVGYHVVIQFTDWVTAKALSKNGDYDGLIGGYYKEERKKYYTYSLPVISANTIFIARKSLNAVYDGNLKNLKNFRLGVSKGYTYSKVFDNAGYLNKIEASGPKSLIDLILLQQVDVVLISEQVARYYLLQRSIKERQSLITLGPSLAHKKMHILISKKKPEHLKVASDFNQGLKKLVSSGKMSELLP